jgi:hypothetical protein
MTWLDWVMVLVFFFVVTPVALVAVAAEYRSWRRREVDDG